MFLQFKVVEGSQKRCSNLSIVWNTTGHELDHHFNVLAIFTATEFLDELADRWYLFRPGRFALEYDLFDDLPIGFNIERIIVLHLCCKLLNFSQQFCNSLRTMILRDGVPLSLDEITKPWVERVAVFMQHAP